MSNTVHPSIHASIIPAKQNSHHRVLVRDLKRPVYAIVRAATPTHPFTPY